MNFFLRIACTLCLLLALPLSAIAATDTSPADIAKQLQQGPVWTILDVRTPAEFATGHVQNARNIDALDASFATNIAALPRDATYMVYCRTARRSAKAVATMESMGFTHIIHMKDGIVGWKKSKLPVVMPAKQ